MQIRAITVNAAGLTPGQGIQPNRKQPQPQAEDNVFSAGCKVTISKEGRSLSRQQASQAEKKTQDTQNPQSVKAERMLLRRQEEAEQDKKIRDGYREELKEIEDQIKNLNSSYPSLRKVGEEAIEKEQEVQRAMRNQKQAQMDENQKRAKEAQQMAMQSAEYQEEIDENNRDLLTLLKTMEEAEKAEDEQEGGETESGGSGASGAGGSVGDAIQGSAAQFLASSVKREWNVEEQLAQLGDDGRGLLMSADAVTRKVLDTIDGIRKALDDESYTNEQIDEMMRLLKDGDTDPGTVKALRAGGGKSGMELNYDDVRFSRRDGLYLERKAREHKLENIASDPLRGMQDTKKSMMASSLDAALGEARQSSLDKASQELEDEVKKLIDERNDIDNIRQEREEDEEEQAKKAEEEQEEEKAAKNEEKKKTAENQEVAQSRIQQPF